MGLYKTSPLDFMSCLPQSLELSQILSYSWAQWFEGLFRYEPTHVCQCRHSGILHTHVPTHAILQPAQPNTHYFGGNSLRMEGKLQGMSTHMYIHMSLFWSWSLE